MYLKHYIKSKFYLILLSLVLTFNLSYGNEKIPIEQLKAFSEVYMKIKKDYVDFFDEDGVKINKKVLELSSSEEKYDKGDYKHFMAKEIEEQSVTLKNGINEYIDKSNNDINIYNFPWKNEEISTFKAVQDYILNVLGSYLSLQLLKNEKVITQQGRDSAQMNYKKASQLVKLGAKTKIDLYSPEISLLNANRDLLEINKNIKTALTAFQFLINPNKKVEVKPVDFLTFRPYFKDAFDKNWERFQKDWEKVLLKNNSDIKMELNNMEKSKNSLGQEKLNMWPQLTASASHTWDLAEQFKSGDTNPQSFQAGLNLTWTVFDWGKSRANLKSSIYNLETSELNFKKQIFEKKNTILKLFQDYKILGESIKSSQLILKKAKAQHLHLDFR